MNILAIDAATKLGWALSVNGQTTSGVQLFDLKRGESPGMRWLRFGSWLREMQRLNPIDIIYFEQAHHRGGAATSVGVGFVTKIHEFAAAVGAETCPVHTATLKSFAARTAGIKSGKGKVTMAAADKFGWSYQDDNEADALWLLQYAITELGCNEPLRVCS